MVDLYLLTTLGTISDFCFITGTIIMLLTVFCTIAHFSNDYASYELDMKFTHRKFLKRAWIVYPILLMIGLLIPSKKDLYIIYGLGTTIDYLKENPDAKQLPDKCIKALDIWLDKQIEK